MKNMNNYNRDILNRCVDNFFAKILIFFLKYLFINALMGYKYLFFSINIFP